jgi:hypothetical protein
MAIVKPIAFAAHMTPLFFRFTPPVTLTFSPPESLLSLPIRSWWPGQGASMTKKAQKPKFSAWISECESG